MIKILLADDQPLVIAGIKMLLQGVEGIQIIGEALHGRQALDLVVKEKPDIVFTDIQMPEMDGIELTKVLHEHYPEIGIIALTAFEDDIYIVDMLEAGAKGYLLKTTHQEQMAEAIRVVYSHGYYYCNDTSLKLLKRIARTKKPAQQMPAGIKLSEIEIQIIQCIIDQLSSKEIGDKLHLSQSTVEGYRSKIFQKMGVKNMAGAVVNAIRWGLVDVEQKSVRLPPVSR